MERPRTYELYRGSLLAAHRTAPVDGEPAELWELSEMFREDPTFVTMFADAARFLEARRWQSLPSLVMYEGVEMIVVAPPWVSLATIAAHVPVLEPALVLSIVRDIARDLASSPDTALRTLTPKSIAISTWGRPRLLDFMFAIYPQRSSVTMSGVIKGEFSYMSPEQSLGRKIDHRSDVFTLGLVAYELLTGMRAIDGKTDFEKLQRVRDARIDLDPLREQPAGVADLVARMVLRDRNERIAAHDLANAIEQSPWSWPHMQVYEAARALAPEHFDAAILYGI